MLILAAHEGEALLVVFTGAPLVAAYIALYAVLVFRRMFHLSFFASLPLAWLAKLLLQAEAQSGDELAPRLFSVIPIISVGVADWIIAASPPGWCRYFYSVDERWSRVVTFLLVVLIQVIVLGASELFSIPRVRMHWS